MCLIKGFQIRINNIYKNRQAYSACRDVLAALPDVFAHFILLIELLFAFMGK